MRLSSFSAARDETEARTLPKPEYLGHADGRYELYKTSLKFSNPVTRLPHGFPISRDQIEVKEMLQDGAGTWTTR